MEEEGSRSRRSRKTVNYAELNDFYLPPLGPGDIVGREEVGSRPQPTRKRRIDDSYIQQDYLAPRVRSTARRFRGQLPGLETLKEESRSSSPAESASPLDSGVNHSPFLHQSVGVVHRQSHPAEGYDSGSGSVREEEEEEGGQGDDEMESEASVMMQDSSPSSDYSSSGCGSDNNPDRLVVEMPLPPAYSLGGHGLNHHAPVGMLPPRAEAVSGESARGPTHTAAAAQDHAHHTDSTALLQPTAPQPSTQQGLEPTPNHWSDPSGNTEKTLEYMVDHHLCRHQPCS